MLCKLGAIYLITVSVLVAVGRMVAVTRPRRN